MHDDVKPASAADLAFALRYSGRKRVHDSAEILAAIGPKACIRDPIGNARKAPGADVHPGSSSRYI